MYDKLTFPYEAFPALQARVRSSFRVVHSFNVSKQPSSNDKILAALTASVQYFTRVTRVVDGELTLPYEALPALRARVRDPLGPFLAVHSFKVYLQPSFTSKTLTALIAGERLFPRVSRVVDGELTLLQEAFPALKARVRSSFRAVHSSQVSPQPSSNGKTLAALTASIQHFTRVSRAVHR